MSEEEAKSDIISSPSSQGQRLVEPSEHGEESCQHAGDTAVPQSHPTESSSTTIAASPSQESEPLVTAATPSDEASSYRSAISSSQEPGFEEPSPHSEGGREYAEHMAIPLPQAIESSSATTTTTTTTATLSSLLQEPDLPVATANFLTALKDLKFLTLPNPYITPYGKQEIHTLTSASWPAQELLLESVWGTPDAPGPLASFDGIRLLDEDAERLTDAVNAAAYCLLAILVQMGLLKGVRVEQKATGAEIDGNCCPAIQSGQHNNDLLVTWTTAQTLNHRFKSAHEAVHELTETLREVLTKYGVKHSEPTSDHSLLTTPALPAASKNEESQPEPDSLIGRAIKRIGAFIRARLLPPEPQEEEEEPSVLGYDDGADDNPEFLRDKLEYQYLTRRYPTTKNFSRREPKHINYHKEAEQRFVDLQAKFDERQQSHPHLHTSTGQLLFRRQVETRILLHRGWQSSLMRKDSEGVGEGKVAGSQDKTEEKTQGAHQQEPEVLKT
ncbi:hypothetical protein PG990_002088 [Apiospora arundinis]